MTAKADINLDLLRKLYVDERNSIPKCAARFGVSRTAITNALKRAGIPIISKPQKKVFDLSKEDAEQWLSEGMTVKAIAERLDAPQMQVAAVLQSYGLVYNRNPQKAQIPPREELERLYETMTFVDLGKHYGVSNVTVARWVREYGISVRKRSEAIKMAMREKSASNATWTGFGDRVFLTEEEWKVYCRRPPVRHVGRLFKDKERVCSVCGASESANNKLQASHIVPFRDGIRLFGLTPDWLDRIDNLRLACAKTCNSLVEMSREEIIKHLKDQGYDFPGYVDIQK